MMAPDNNHFPAWKTIDDGLPECGEWVLVSYSFSRNDPDTFTWLGRVLTTGEERRKFWSGPEGDEYICVRAWMPMPEPYKTRKEHYL